MTKIRAKKVRVYFVDGETVPGGSKIEGKVEPAATDKTLLGIYDARNDQLVLIPYTSIIYIEVLEVGV